MERRNAHIIAAIAVGGVLVPAVAVLLALPLMTAEGAAAVGSGALTVLAGVGILVAGRFAQKMVPRRILGVGHAIAAGITMTLALSLALAGGSDQWRAGDFAHPERGAIGLALVGALTLAQALPLLTGSSERAPRASARILPVAREASTIYRLEVDEPTVTPNGTQPVGNEDVPSA